MRVLLTDEAKSDLGKIPLRLQEKIRKKISYLQDFPLMGARMEDVFKGFRCLLAGGGLYKVIYKIREKEVVVYYIRHASRQIGLRVVR